MNLKSNFKLNDECFFTPRQKDLQALLIKKEELPGQIKAIKFTEAKVYYDIYSPIWNHLFTEVDEMKVNKKSMN